MNSPEEPASGLPLAPAPEMPETPPEPLPPGMEQMPEPTIAPPLPLAPEQLEAPPQNGAICPNCGPVSPFSDTQEDTVRVLDFTEVIPKCRQIIELYGGTNVQIAPRAKTLTQSGYLILNNEHDVAEMQDRFPHIADKISATADSERYDRWARSPSIVQSDDDAEICTCRQVWLRPWMFNKLGKADDERVMALKAQFPSGIRADLCQ